jgi:hypothetical protein
MNRKKNMIMRTMKKEQEKKVALAQRRNAGLKYLIIYAE